MGLNLKMDPSTEHLPLAKKEMDLYIKRFNRLDYGGKGYITINDLRNHMKVFELILLPGAPPRGAERYRRIWNCGSWVLRD